MRAGSVTAAARNLHITQPAVSAVLKHTEQQLKMKLFERIGGRLHPTPEVLALLPDMEEIFGRIDTVSRAVQELRDGRTGKLVFATSLELSGKFDALSFRPFRPRVEVKIQLVFPRDRPRSRASMQLAGWLIRKYRRKSATTG